MTVASKIFPASKIRQIIRPHAYKLYLLAAVIAVLLIHWLLSPALSPWWNALGVIIFLLIVVSAQWEKLTNRQAS